MSANWITCGSDVWNAPPGAGVEGHWFESWEVYSGDCIFVVSCGGSRGV